ncbi:MAG: flagellar basal body rod protein FlgB [Burkholderiales bacterium]|nr:flagellar basal body rod protein FlgB [Burkholderiales bacterium]
MISRLDREFEFYQQALQLRSARQQVLASNIANADTPNYKARDFDFAKALQGVLSGNATSAELAKTDPRHLSVPSVFPGVKLQYSNPYQSSLDNNTVEMDVERNKYMDNSIRFEADLTATTSKIKVMLSAIQG